MATIFTPTLGPVFAKELRHDPAYNGRGSENSWWSMGRIAMLPNRGPGPGCLPRVSCGVCVLEVM